MKEDISWGEVIFGLIISVLLCVLFATAIIYFENLENRVQHLEQVNKGK